VHAMHTSQSGVSNNLAYLSHGQKADARVRSAQALQCAFTGWQIPRMADAAFAAERASP